MTRRIGGVESFDRLQPRRPVLGFPVAVFAKFADDGGWRLGALVAYYAFLSIFPMLLAFVTVLGMLLPHHPGLQASLLRSALADVPVFGDQLRLHGLHGEWWVLVISLVTTLWGMQGVASALQHALNQIWNVPQPERPGVFRELWRSFRIVGTVGLGVIITGALGEAGSWGGWGILVRVVALALAVLIGAVAFAVSFHVAIATRPPYASVAPGAVAGSVMWQIMLYAGSALISHVARHAESLYGAFGVVLGLLVWLQLLAGLTLLLAEADVVRVRSLWPRGLTGSPRPMPTQMSAVAEASTPEPQI